MTEEKGNDSVKQPDVSTERPDTPEVSSLKEYFDERLYPHLSAALTACARERPVDPVEFVGKFLVNVSAGKHA
jgi:hypothetical protein